MASEGLSEKQGVRNISWNLRGKASEKDIDAAMREVKPLLEADVNFVVKHLLATIKEKAMGADVLKA